MVAPGVYHLQRVSSTRSLSEVKVKERHMKRVQFEDKMKVYRIRSRKHLTKSEFQNSYMSARDFRRIKNEVKGLLQKMKAGKLSAEDVEELRGLEAYSDPETTMRNNAKKKYIVHSILCYQESEHNDCETLSKMYQRLSNSAVHLAHKQGLLDQQQGNDTAPKAQRMLR